MPRSIRAGPGLLRNPAFGKAALAAAPNHWMIPLLVFSPLASFLTDAGDSGVLLPIALVGVATLWFFQSRRVAWLLLRSVLVAGLFIAALKILFLSCAAHWATGLSSPSGHACLSAVVYGTMATLVASGRAPLVRALIYVLTALFVAAIGVSRVTLGVHTWIEVGVGLSVGLLAQSWFAWSYARTAPVRIDLKTFGAALAVTVLVAFGIRLPAESLIRHLARRLGEKCTAVAPVVPPALATGAWRSMASSAPEAQPALSRASTSSASARALWS